MESGIQPDVLVCRTEHSLSDDIRKKIALFCNVNRNAVIESLDVETIYDVPIKMLKEKLDRTVLAKMKLPLKNEPELEQWKDFLWKLKNPKMEVDIGLVGKYVELPDAYKSIIEAFIHAGAQRECKVKLHYIHSESISEESAKYRLGNLDGILVAPGFGDRGIEGKIEAIRYVREHNIPFFGICLGMQCAVIEFARYVLKMKDAHSTEMNAKTKHAVIDMMEEQKKISQKGGTMRLGSYPCNLAKGSKALTAYGKAHITERHRHRYEFNNKFQQEFMDAGMSFTGVNPDTNLVEIIELNKHPYFLAVQYHPELKSTVEAPHPLFVRFIKAAQEHKLAEK